MRRLIAYSTLLLLLLTAAVAPAQMERIELRKIAQQSLDYYKKQGWNMRDEVVIGQLKRAQSAYFDVHLTVGNEYFFVFGGDVNLKSVTATVFDETWAQAASAQAKGPVELKVKPEGTGVHHIRVTATDVGGGAGGAYWYALAGYK